MKKLILASLLLFSTNIFAYDLSFVGSSNGLSELREQDYTTPSINVGVSLGQLKTDSDEGIAIGAAISPVIYKPKKYFQLSIPLEAKGLVYSDIEQQCETKCLGYGLLTSAGLEAQFNYGFFHAGAAQKIGRIADYQIRKPFDFQTKFVSFFAGITF